MWPLQQAGSGLRGNGPKGQGQKWLGSLRPFWEVTRRHLCYILVVQASYKAQTDWSERVDWLLQEELPKSVAIFSICHRLLCNMRLKVACFSVRSSY